MSLKEKLAARPCKNIRLTRAQPGKVVYVFSGKATTALEASFRDAAKPPSTPPGG